MPYQPQEIWYATPEKTNHSTKGWYHKTLFTFQMATEILSIPAGNDIIADIISNGKNYKGSNELPAYYFADNNDNGAGRGFKITVIYEYALDGSKTGLSVGLYDPTGPNSFLTSNNCPVTSDSGYLHATAQFYCTSFWDNAESYPAFQVNGDLMWSNKSSGTNDVYKVPFYEALQITAGNAIPYQLQLINYSDNSMYINYVSIEEIG